MNRVITALLSFMAYASAATAQTHWRAATEYPATAMPGEGLTTFAHRLLELSGGQIEVRPEFDGPGGLRSLTIPAAVQSGQLAVGDAFAGALSSLDPIFQLSSLPFLATSQADALRLYQAAKPAYAAAFASRGQRLLYATPWPASGVWSQSAIDGPADLRDLPIRTYDATSTAALARAGAAAIELSFADTMPRLRDGSVRAVLSSGDGGAGRRLWEVTRHFTAIGYAMPLSFTTLRTAAYDALPEALQRATDQAAADTETAQWSALIERTGRNYATMRANAVEIHEASPALSAMLRQAGDTIIADWMATAGPAASIVTAYRRRSN